MEHVRKPLFCDNETNTPRLFSTEPITPFPKDGINDHVVSGADTVNPAQRGTKAAWWYHLTVPGGGSVELRLRLSRPAADPARIAPKAGRRRRSTTCSVAAQGRGRRVLRRDRSR